MSDNYDSVIDQDWDELALDDGTIVDEFGTYSATIYPRDGTGANTLESQIEGISYSPEVNSAKGISVDVEPLSALEGTDYLGGIVDVFVNNQPIFSGKIYTIDTSSEEGTFYTLEAEPPAKQLRNETINETTDNFLLSDYCGKTIDRFNDFDDEHFNLIDTADESLTDIDKVGRGREATSNSAAATYSNVASDASNIDILYVKLLVNGSVDVTIDTANSSYSETFTSSSGTYGDWFKIEPSGLDAEQYDIQYSLETGSVLYDWISITSSEVTRTLEPEVAEAVRQQETIQDASTNTEWNDILNISATDPYKIENDKLIPLPNSYPVQVEERTVFSPTTDRNDFAKVSSSGTSNSGSYFTSETDENRFTVNFPYEIPPENLKVYVRGEEIARDDSNDEFTTLEIYPESNPTDQTDQYTGGIALPDTVGWQSSSMSDNRSQNYSGDEFFVLAPNQDFASSDFSGPYGETQVDMVVFVDNRYSYSFDNSVDSNQRLETPRIYSVSNFPRLEFNQIVFGEVIETGYLDVNTNDPNGVGELGVFFDSGTSFLTSTNTTSLQKDNVAQTSSIIGRVGTKGWEENGVRDDTPKLGYSAQEISLYDLAVDTNDIEILFNSDPSGNRLKVLTDIIDSSRLYYRVEGSDIRMFRRGDKQTNVDLRKEDVTSSVSIDDVYSSCEVIGDGVRSGVIEASNPVPYVDRHKEIRDPDITNEDDATRRARSFLEEHSDVEYQGNISTLPTLAPLGEEIDGSIFSHGKDSFIESVRYGKRRTTIDVGRTKDLQSELLNLDRGVGSSRTRDTGV